MSTKASSILLIVLVLLECAGVGYLGVWREGFWQAVETRNLHIFISKIAEFTTVALVLCIIAGYSQFLINKISLLIRTDLTRRTLQRPMWEIWHIEGCSQRIQEDCLNYPWYGLTLLVGLLRSFLNVGIFAVIIIMQLGAAYLLVPVVYTLISTAIAHRLGSPLIKLNYLHQCVEAKFRQHLQKQFAEDADRVYEECYDNYMNLAVTTKKLQYFQSFFNQITVVVPYIIVAPLYFGTKILFGTFMQVASAMAHVIESMSYVLNSYEMINNWLSCRRRLKELKVIK